MVGGVGIVLGFQAKGVVWAIGPAALAGVPEEVAGIELHPRLVGKDLHGNAGPGTKGPGSQPAALAGQNVVVVKALGGGQGRMADILADGLGGGEVQRRILDR